MKSFYGLIPRYLMKNKKRNLFLGLSIMFSVLIITVLNISFNKVIDDAWIRNKEDTGVSNDMYAATKEVNKDFLCSIEKNDIISEKTSQSTLGIYKFNDFKNNSKQYILYVNGYEDNLENFFNFKLLEGSYPKNDKEIALESWVLPYLGKNLVVGDSIKLNLITSIINNNMTYFEDEYKIVGIIEYESKAKFYENGSMACVTREFAEKNNIDNCASYANYYKFKEGMDLIQGYNKVIPKEDGKVVIESNYNQDKKSMIDAVNAFKNAKNITCFIIAILATILIYNMVNITVSLRMKEIGMLKSLGAEKNQIRMLLLGEGILTGTIFIPIGILLGIGFNEVIQWYSLKELYMFGGLKIELSMIIVIILFSMIPIILGILIGVKKVSKLSAIEAMNYKDDNNVMKVKGKGLICENNKFYKSMAKKNIKKNKSKFINTVFSLSITIFMFMMISYIVNCNNPIFKNKHTINPDFTVNSIGYPIEEQSITQIKNLEGVKEIHVIKEEKKNIKISQDKITNGGNQYIEKRNLELGIENNETNKNLLQHNIWGYDDKMLEDLKPFILDGKIDINELKSGNKIILAQNLNNSNISSYSVGDILSISINEKEVKEYEIVAILNQKEFALSTDINTISIMSDSTFNRSYNSKSINILKIYLKNDEYHDEVISELNKEFGKNNYTLKDVKKEQKEEINKKTSLTIVLYGMIVVLAITSIFNIINIMYMNIASRKKEISMLRAIGMGKDEVKAMVVKEGFYYYIYSSITGVTLGVLGTYLFFQLTKKSFTTGMIWSLPIGTILSIFIVMALVCLFASLNACKSVLDESIVEGVKAIE